VAIDPAAPRSRRAILAGALGGAGALIANSLGRATPVAAADGDPLLLGRGTTPTDNEATTATILNASVDHAFVVKTTAGNGAVEGWTSFGGIGVFGVTGNGVGVQGQSSQGPGVMGLSGPGQTDTGGASRHTGVIGSTGDSTTFAENTDETGVYGFANDSGGAAGVWGDSLQGIGVVGTGDWGMYGFGSAGVVGDAASVGTGVYGFAGAEEIVTPPPGAGVVGRAGAGAIYGVVAAASAANQFALYVAGRLRLNGPGGRTSFTSTATSKKIVLAGVTTSSFVVATLQTSISGCYVRAVVPAAGSFTIYLSKAPGKTAVVGYIVAN
jgi:hypothetical protein